MSRKIAIIGMGLAIASYRALERCVQYGNEVTEDNRLFVMTQLKKGDYVRFVLDFKHTDTSKALEGFIESVEYNFDSMYPLIFFRDSKTGKVDAIHSGWLQSWLPHGTMSCDVFLPKLPLELVYNYSDIIVRTLFNKYGNSPQWKNTLYDIDKIASTVVSKAPSFKRLDSSNLRRFKKIILQVAPRLKVTRNDFIIASIKGARDLQEIHEDYQAWEDYDQ